MDNRPDGIIVFVQAVEAGSFSLAAERIGLTRSAVRKAIARLERRLSTRLFHRTTRQQRLTDDGQAYYERCARVLAELDVAESALEGRNTELQGRLRVTMPAEIGRHYVAPVLKELVRAHPQLQVDMFFSDRVVDLVDEGFDLAVRVGALADSATLAARLLGVQWMQICASPSYLHEHGVPESIAKLQGHAFLSLLHSSQKDGWTLIDGKGQSHNVETHSRLRLNDLEAVADMAIAGMGLACLPTWLIQRHQSSGQLIRILKDFRASPAEVHMVWPQSRYLSPRIRAAINALVDAWAQLSIVSTP